MRDPAHRRAVEANVARLPEPLRGPVQRVVDNIANFARKGLYAFAFTHDLADMAAKSLPSVGSYMRFMAAKSAVKNDHELKVEAVLGKFERLEGAEAGTGEGSVNRFLHDSTRSGRWGFEPAAGQGPAKVDVDPDLARRFDALSKPAQAVVREVFAHGHATLRRKQDAVRAEIDSEFDQRREAAGDAAQQAKVERQRAAALRQFDRLLSIQGDGPYAPLKRFGNYVVVARSKQYLDAEKGGDHAAVVFRAV